MVLTQAAVTGDVARASGAGAAFGSDDGWDADAGEVERAGG
jgi:hypothetical protein